MDGICTLANDGVYDQVIALLNSIEAVLGPDFPVCIYPYDHNTERLQAELAHRPNVSLYSDQASIQKWDEFVQALWRLHPTASQKWQSVNGGQPPASGVHRFGVHRRFCAFDGPFDRFLYMDADTLLLGPVSSIFERLEHYDWVVYDFQYKDPSHVYDLASPKLPQLFTPDQLQNQMFCSGLYATRKGVFDADRRQAVLNALQAGDAEVLYSMAPDQTILNYMVMHCGLRSCNLALQLPETERTGCCVTSPHFQEQNHLLYDHGRPLTYLHYIGLSSKLFRKLCQGENVMFPYRDLFLHYRYLKEPEQRPQFTTPPKAYDAPIPLKTRIFKKLGLLR